MVEFDGGSFRDPSGRVFWNDGRIFRAVYPLGQQPLRQAIDSGVLQSMIDDGWLLEAELVKDETLRSADPAAELMLEHPPLDFVSYPYEWCFSQLKAAALHHLDFQLALLAKGFTLSDATAYNVQFRGTKPVFIDHLSIHPYEEGAPWIGQRQFGMQFLNPLLIWSKKDIAPLSWYRGAVEGIEPEELNKLLGFRDKLSFTVLAHIVGPALVAKRRVKAGIEGKEPGKAKLSKPRLVALLTTLRDYIAGLAPPGGKTVWDDYAAHNTYGEDDRDAKSNFVSEYVQKFSAHQVFDLGCNSGDYSLAAFDAGAENVVGFDFDLGALERAFARFDKEAKPILPLWLNAANPSPAQGWMGAERKSFDQRANPDMLLALALIHHLCIAKNIPLDMAVEWLVGLAPTGIIEFPSKSDPMVQLLLRDRTDIFPNYTEESFLEALGKRAKIVDQRRIGKAGRLIVAYERHK